MMMEHENFNAPMNPFSEYALLLEADDYPKTEVTMFQLTGKVDEAALAESYRDAMNLVPLFSCHLTEKRQGLFYRPTWVYDAEMENRLVIEDCRHLVTDEFDIVEFTDMYFRPHTRRRLDLYREFPFNSHLIRVTDKDYIFAMVFHHSVLDPFKALTVLTAMLAGYHERIKSERPEWADAISVAAVNRKQKGQLVKPLPALEFAREQLGDIWFRNRKSTISRTAVEKVLDYREVKGRYSLRHVIDDPKLILALVNRALALDATLNDLIMAVARKVISRWNEDKGRPHDRTRMMLATSLLGRAELPKNSGAGLAGLNFVSAGHGHSDLETVIKFFRDQRASQLARGVDIQFFNTLTRIVTAMRVLPLRTRNALARPIVEGIPCTFSLSNVGSLWPKGFNPDGTMSLESKITTVGDFTITSLHSSISIAKNLDMVMVTRTHHNKFFMNFVADRYRFRKDEFNDLKDRLVKGLLDSV